MAVRRTVPVERTPETIAWEVFGLALGRLLHASPRVRVILLRGLTGRPRAATPAPLEQLGGALQALFRAAPRLHEATLRGVFRADTEQQAGRAPDRRRKAWARLARAGEGVATFYGLPGSGAR